MCGGGGGSGGGDEGNMGIDDSVADQSAVSGDTSTVGDDSNDDSTAFGGVSGNQGIGNEVSGSNTQADDEDALSGFEGANMGLSNQAVNAAVSSSPNAGLSNSAIASIGIAANQYSPGDITGFAGNKDGRDVSDYSLDIDALEDARENMKKGSLFRDPKNPLSYALNYLSKIGPQNTISNIEKGYAPTYGPDGNITGTTGYGIGMGMPGNDNNMSGAGSSVPGYSGFDATSPSMGMNGGATDIGGNENDELEIIRRNLSDEEEFPIAPAPISDDLAINYLQDPYYLYSGQGNLYQPYGYAQNTLVDLLRTRNMTQPQQRAANLGLFGNPGDFS